MVYASEHDVELAIEKTISISHYSFSLYKSSYQMVGYIPWAMIPKLSSTSCDGIHTSGLIRQSRFTFF